MALQRMTAEQALADYGAFDAVVDARSESEFAQDHLPGAVNWPTLTDEQRHTIGTEYKQISPFDARKRGAALAALNIAQHVHTHVMPLPRTWKPLVYCWRGGQRSGSLSLVLSEIGFQVRVLDGGYRAFRRALLDQMQTLPGSLQFTVLCGPTGSAKSRLLQALAEQGAQVLDLEALACHRGSVLGPLPGQPQPTQKAFETQVWQALRGFDNSKAVFVESESRTIGRLRVPETLLVQMRAGSCVRLDMTVPERVAFLLQDYAHFVQDTELFCTQLNALRELRGAATVERWQALAREQAASTNPTNSSITSPNACPMTSPMTSPITSRISDPMTHPSATDLGQGPLARVVQELLEQHYDPVYLKSMQRNYAKFEQAQRLHLANANIATLHQQAALLIQAQNAAP